MTTITGAQVVAEALIEREIPHIFSLSGGHITPIYQYLEGSNVEVVSELVSLITAQRAYEINSRAIRAGDEMLSSASDLVR